MSFSFLSGAVPTTNTNFNQVGFILPSEVEKALGNPSSNGQVLASNTNGVRYWTSNINADVLSVETLIANGTVGIAGQGLVSDGQNVYWSNNPGYTGSQGAQGVQGAIGFTGSQGAQGVQGTIGAQGVQGAQGAQGAIGFTGSQGLQGAQGVIGFTGSQGLQGVQGAQGAQGAIGYTGSQGAQGVQGAIGFTGSQGLQGIQGAIGPQGAQGVQGSSGTSVTIIDSVANVNDAYPGGGPNNPVGYLGYYYPSAAAGNGVIDRATGALWVYSGVTWNNVGVIVGPQGPLGYTGSQGLQGVQGVQGAIGFTGSQGAFGYTGSQGTQGRDGNFGGASFYYKWTNDTSSTTVANGYVELSNTNPTLASFIGISNLDRFNSDISSFIQTIDDSTSAIKGSIKLTEEANNTNFIIYNVTGTHINDGAHFDIPISFVAGAFTPPANDVFIIASFIVNGDKGDPGPIGYTGSQGSQGAQGAQGAQGTQGNSGFVGSKGVTYIANTAPVPAQPGDTWWNSINGVRYVYYTDNDSSQWVQETSIGPIGFTGYVGSRGDLGYTGSTGTGTQGASGYTGSASTAAGAQGAQGRQGAQGTAGPQGPQGPQGVQGSIGYTGSASGGGGAGPYIDQIYINWSGGSFNSTAGYTPLVYKGTGADPADVFSFYMVNVFAGFSFVPLTLPTSIAVGDSAMGSATYYSGTDYTNYSFSGYAGGGISSLYGIQISNPTMLAVFTDTAALYSSPTILPGSAYGYSSDNTNIVVNTPGPTFSNSYGGNYLACYVTKTGSNYTIRFGTGDTTYYTTGFPNDLYINPAGSATTGMTFYGGGSDFTVVSFYNDSSGYVYYEINNITNATLQTWLDNSIKP